MLSFKKKYSLLAASSLCATGLLFANEIYASDVNSDLPMNGMVVDGNAKITYTSQSVDIEQSSEKGIINWNSFSVGAGKSVNFYQPSADSSTLNRVTGNFTSEIAGQIIADGSVFLINPNGIMITPTGQIDTGNFVASTLDIDDEDFKNGKYTFSNKSKKGVIDNRGHIWVSDGGFVALLGGAVKNTGRVKAHLGTIGFAGGKRVVMSFGDNDFLRVEVPTDKLETLKDADGNKLSAVLSTSGEVSSSGGFVQLTIGVASDILRQSISIEGIVSANTVSEKEGVISISGGTLNIQSDGEVTADADYGTGGTVVIDSNKLNMSGKVTAVSKQGDGGKIQVHLQQGASLDGGSAFDVSGGNDGGSISLVAGKSKQSKVLGSADFVADGNKKYGGYIDITSKNGLVGLFSGTISAQGDLQGEGFVSEVCFRVVHMKVRQVI